MTTINPNQVSNGGDIPNGITTIEELIVWLGTKYNQIHGASVYSEQLPTSIDTGQRPRAVADTLSTSPAGPQVLVRAAVPIAPGYATAGTAVWEQALEAATGALP